MTCETATIVKCAYKYFVNVSYKDTSPDSVWGPFSKEGAEAVCIQLAGSPQVIAKCMVTKELEQV